MVNRATAVQDEAMVALAAIEPEVLDDGTVVESYRAAGHTALDAQAIVSGVLSVSVVHAERRMGSAVRLAADGPAGTGTETGLGGLHVAMRAGDLDGYRASVVAEELEEARPEVPPPSSPPRRAPVARRRPAAARSVSDPAVPDQPRPRAAAGRARP